MATVGQTIENPVNGERLTWVETAASSGGEVLAFDLELRPDAAVAAAHRHLRQEESFTVTLGALGLSVAGRDRTLGLGESLTVEAGVPHYWWNAGEEAATIRIEIRPALETEVFFETFFGLARDGKTNAKGIPGLLQIAVSYAELAESCPRVVKPPDLVQRLLLTPLAPIGRLLGRRAAYPSYSADRANGAA